VNSKVAFHTVNLIFAIFFLATLGACSGHWPPNTPSAYDMPLPAVNLQGEALKKYQFDAASCQSELLKRYGDRYGSNNAITDMRKCVIDKGYVLLN
jgi:hypothetical protein